MDEHTYLVVRREGSWWVINSDARSGPYSEEDAAKRVAVTRARLSGGDGEAWEDVPGGGMPRLYP